MAPLLRGRRGLGLVFLVLGCDAAWVFDVRDFGAVASEKVANTIAFRRAAAAVGAAGGGVLLVPPGRFVTGAFNLTSRTTLRVEGAILGAESTEQYPIVPPLPSYGVSRDGAFVNRHQALVAAWDATQVRVVGSGVIDGRGAFWWSLVGSPRQRAGRPRLVEFVNCTDVEIGGLTLRDAGFWTLHPVYSARVWVHDVIVRAPVDSPNTDGIDPDSSRDVLIERVDVECGDDHVALKSGLDAAGRAVGLATRNVTIRDSIFRGGRGLSIGSEVSGGIDRVRFVDSLLLGPSKHGLHLKTARARAGFITDVAYRNVTIGNVTDDALLSIKTDYGGIKHDDDDDGDDDNTALTYIAHIRFNDLGAALPGPTFVGPPTQRRAGDFACFARRPCDDLAFVDVDFPDGASWTCENVQNSTAARVKPAGLATCLDAPDEVS